MVLVLAYCGLRWGEATALKRRDVDSEWARIEVKGAVERVGRGVFPVRTPMVEQAG